MNPPKGVMEFFLESKQLYKFVDYKAFLTEIALPPKKSSMSSIRSTRAAQSPAAEMPALSEASLPGAFRSEVVIARAVELADRILFQGREWSKAKRYGDRRAETVGEAATLLATVGRLEEAQRLVKKSAPIFHQFSRRSIELPETTWRQAEAFARAGASADAKEMLAKLEKYRKKTTFVGDIVTMLGNRAKVLAILGDGPGCITALRELHQETVSDFLFALDSVVKELAAQGRFDEARCVAVMPADLGSLEISHVSLLRLNRLGALQLKLGDKVSAHKTFEQVAKVDAWRWPNDRHKWYIILQSAISLAGLGRKKDALREFSTLWNYLERSIESSELPFRRMSIVTAHVEVGYFREALQLWRKCDSPPDSEARNAALWDLGRQGDLQPADHLLILLNSYDRAIRSFGLTSLLEGLLDGGHLELAAEVIGQIKDVRYYGKLELTPQLLRHAIQTQNSGKILRVLDYVDRTCDAGDIEPKGNAWINHYISLGRAFVAEATRAGRLQQMCL